MQTIPIVNRDGQRKTTNVDASPNECPFCHEKQVVDINYSVTVGSDLEALCKCSNSRCGKLFIAYFTSAKALDPKRSESFFFKSVSVGNIKTSEFDSNITDVSSSFVEIFQQAERAEIIGLNHLAGMGYRKALEFLMKDYLIKKFPEKANKIEEKLLGACINEFVIDPNIKIVAKNAAYLGNDQTHYVRKWPDKDINDLKVLIQLTIAWITMEVLTQKYKDEMGG
jgi:hypothetical protein